MLFAEFIQHTCVEASVFNYVSPVILIDFFFNLFVSESTICFTRIRFVAGWLYFISSDCTGVSNAANLVYVFITRAVSITQLYFAISDCSCVLLEHYDRNQALKSNLTNHQLFPFSTYCMFYWHCNNSFDYDCWCDGLPTCMHLFLVCFLCVSQIAPGYIIFSFCTVDDLSACLRSVSRASSHKAFGL